jgi:hypothetical protein
MCHSAGASHSCETGTSSAVCALHSPFPAAPAGGRTARQHRVPLARCDHSETSTHCATRATRLPSPATAGGGLPGVAHAGSTFSTPRSQRDEHAQCHSCDAIALPSHCRRRAHTGRHMRAPPQARRYRSETSTHSAARATHPPSHGRRRACLGQHTCVPPPACSDCSEASTHRAALATRPPSPATAG